MHITSSVGRPRRSQRRGGKGAAASEQLRWRATQRLLVFEQEATDHRGGLVLDGEVPE